MKKEPSLAAASGDPFYVFKECVELLRRFKSLKTFFDGQLLMWSLSELESKVLAVHLKHAKWRAILEAKDSPASKELPAVTHQIEGTVAMAEKSVKFLDETILMVEANRAKFEHIDATEIASRKAFVAAIRKELQAVLAEISTDAVKTRIRKEERKLMQESSTSFKSTRVGEKTNERFLHEETQRQQQTMQEQDQSLLGLHTDITRLHGVTVEISNEVKHQNTMLDDLANDVDEAQERMTFVMGRLSTLLKTKDKCQIGLILFLVAVLVVLVFLVVYT